MKQIDKVLKTARKMHRDAEDWPGVIIFDSAEEAANYCGRNVVIIDDIPDKDGERSHG